MSGGRRHRPFAQRASFKRVSAAAVNDVQLGIAYSSVYGTIYVCRGLGSGVWGLGPVLGIGTYLWVGRRALAGDSMTECFDWATGDSTLRFDFELLQSAEQQQQPAAFMACNLNLSWSKNGEKIKFAHRTSLSGKGGGERSRVFAPSCPFGLFCKTSLPGNETKTKQKKNNTKNNQQQQKLLHISKKKKKS